MSRARRVVAVVAVLAALTVPACARTPAEPSTTTSGPTTAVSRTQPSSTASPTSPAPASPSVSAEAALTPFVEAAAAADTALQHAATLVSGAVRTDAVVLDEETVAAVRAVDLAAVRATIPAGLPDVLLEPVLTVYSDLASRHAAMAHAGVAARTHPRPGTEADELLACLAHGSPAAARFDADLDAVRAAAAATPPPGPVASGAREGAELAVRLAEIDSRSSGCGACGGYVATTLSSIVWEDAPPGATVVTGTIGGIRVEAAWTADRGWTATLAAC